ncbi:DHS-like NAD/FAD-binding domain-containing protein [Bombardia bombarda]|uniref:DHS-like NAD/FAD-binding domain-containing protein n=1 Tax=Bombardia bombarda TaxID=252184 RepID=A0AA39WND9_9PEZI|nr:DHS-like NAD/FAD-binding domain-containing protein [Bombardia bombarda]
MLSQSPSLPPTPLLLDASKRYPSPSSSSSAASGSASPLKLSDIADDAAEIQVRTDGPPPKRRRVAAPPRPRTTEYIDLIAHPDQDQHQGPFARLLTSLRKKKKIVVIAGAGISVSAGIPDFRSSTGLFTTLRGQHKLKSSGKHLFDASVYKHEDSTTSFHTMVRELAHLTSKAKPTPFHHMLAALAQEGRLMRLYTQNIDSIDTQMEPLKTNVPLQRKGPWPTTIQLHGGLEKMVCTKCGHLEAFNASLFDGPEPPLCEKCKEQDEVRTAFAGKRSHGIGRLRPRIVLYNEYNPDEEAIGNVSKADLRRVPDAVIVVGTSLKIPGVRKIVKEMCRLTRSRRDGLTAWINIDPEPQGAEFKDCWDLVVRGSCDDVAELVGLPPWNDDIGEMDSYMVIGQKEKQMKTGLWRDRLDVELTRGLKRKHTPDASSEISQGDDQPPADLKSKLVEQVQIGSQGGIPTPSASPKPRSPLPLAKPPANAKGKQTRLIFNSPSSSKPKAPGTSAPAKIMLAAQRKPRQSKKGREAAAKPQNTLNQTFKATKLVTASGKAASIKQAVSDIPKSTAPALPSLRPKIKIRDSAPLKGEVVLPSTELPLRAGSSSPRTPVINYETLVTISPESKPRSMGHLID